MRHSDWWMRPSSAPDSHPSIGVNIQGPSLIRTPDWLRIAWAATTSTSPTTRQLHPAAFADHLGGPWSVHPPGSPGSGSPASLRASRSVPERLREAQASMPALAHDLITEMTTPHIASRTCTWTRRAAASSCISRLRGGGPAAVEGGAVGGWHRLRRPAGSAGAHLHARLSLPRHDLGAGDAGPVLPLRGPPRRIRSGADAVQPGHAPCRRAAPRRHAARVLDPGRPCARTHPPLNRRSRRRLGDMARLGSGRGDASGARLGRRGRGVGTFHPQRRLRPRQSAARPGDLREDGVVFLLYAVAGESGIGIARLAPAP